MCRRTDENVSKDNKGVKMIDRQTSEFIDWKEKNKLYTIETMIDKSISKSAPKKFNYFSSIILLSISIAICILLYFVFPLFKIDWLNSIAILIGNIVAGLMASFVLLIFTSRKEKNINYFYELNAEISFITSNLEKQCSINKYEEYNPLIRNIDLVGESKNFTNESYNVLMKYIEIQTALYDFYGLFINNKFNNFLFPEKIRSKHEELILKANNMLIEIKVNNPVMKKNSKEFLSYCELRNNFNKIEIEIFESFNKYIEILKENYLRLKY